MRDDIFPTCRLAHLDRLDRFGHRSNLVELDEDGVRRPLGNSSRDELTIGDVEIVTYNLAAIAQCCRQRAKTIPIILAEPVLYRDNGVAIQPAGIKID